MTAEVLCFSRGRLLDYSGWIAGSDRGKFLTRVDADKRFMDRKEAESSERYIQIIACAVIRTKAGLYQVFETPSSNAYDGDGPASLIVGGHIERTREGDEARSLAQLASEALEREVIEELGQHPASEPSMVGFLIDRSSVKNSRHIGMLHECRIEGPVRPVSAVEFRLDSEFAGTYTAEGLKELRGRMDPWSRIFTDSL